MDLQIAFKKALDKWVDKKMDAMDDEDLDLNLPYSEAEVPYGKYMYPMTDLIKNIAALKLHTA